MRVRSVGMCGNEIEMSGKAGDKIIKKSKMIQNEENDDRNK